MDTFDMKSDYPNWILVLRNNLTEQDRQDLLESFSLYRRTLLVSKIGRTSMWVSLFILAASFIPHLLLIEDMRAIAGLTATISFLLVVAVYPCLEQSVDRLQELSDKALIKSGRTPIDLSTGRPR